MRKTVLKYGTNSEKDGLQVDRHSLSFYAFRSDIPLMKCSVVILSLDTCQCYI